MICISAIEGRLAVYEGDAEQGVGGEHEMLAWEECGVLSAL